MMHDELCMKKVRSSIGEDERFSFSKEEFDSPTDYQIKSAICTAKCYQTGVGDKVTEGSQEPAQGSPTRRKTHKLYSY